MTFRGRGQGDFYLQSRGFDQRNRSVAKSMLPTLMQLLQEALVHCNKLAFFLDS